VAQVRVILAKKRHFLAALFVFATFASVVLRDALKNCSTKSVGLFGDAYSTMWTNLVMTKQSFPPWQQRTVSTGFPQGEIFWPFDWWTSILIRLPLYVLSELFNPICGYNLMVFVGFVFSSSCAWLLAHKVTKNNFISILAGLMFGFGPFAQSAMTGHINYMYIGVLPLLIYLLLKSFSVEGRQLILIGIALGSFSYIDGYFFVPSAILLGLVLVLKIAESISKAEEKHFPQKISLFVTYAFCQVPLLILYLQAIGSNTDQFPARDWNELNVYSIQYWHFLVSSNDNIYYGDFFANWTKNNLNGSNFSETGLFTGYSFLLLAIFCTLYILKNKRLARSGKKSARLSYLLHKKSLKFLIVTAIFGLMLSMKPILNILGISIPMPSGIIFQLAPYWRTISRWGLITTISIIVIGALGYKILVQNLGGKKRIIASILVSVLVIMDLGLPTSLSPKTEKVVQSEGPYAWISENTNDNSVILDVVPYSVDGFFLGHALTAQRKMANTIRPPEKSYQKELLYPGNANFTCALDEAKVDYLVFHPLMDVSGINFDPNSFVKVFEYKPPSNDVQLKWNTADVYRYIGSSYSIYKTEFRRGFELIDQKNGSADWFLTENSGLIKINKARYGRRLSHSLPQLRLSTQSSTEAVLVTIDGVSVWEGKILDTIDIPLRLNSPGTVDIRIERTSPFNSLEPNRYLRVDLADNCRS
jgi:hypothetical protein